MTFFQFICILKFWCVYLSWFPRNADTILENTQVGHMLRTKISSADEGGVAAGFGALDSVYLVDIGKAPKKHV